MIRRTGRNRNIQIALYVILLGLIAFFLCSELKIIFSIHHPRELRDIANVYWTQMFFEGKNPYVIMDNPMQQICYVYTPLNSVIVAGLKHIIPCNIVTLHHLWDFICVFLTAGILGSTIKDKTHNTFWALIVFFLALTISWRVGYITTIPDHLGVLIGVCIFRLLDVIKKYNIGNITVIAILSILLFYAKQYFVFLALPIFVFIFLHDKMWGMIYFLESVLGGIISLAVLNKWCPLFVLYAIYFFADENSGITIEEVKHSIYQFGYVFICYAPFFMAILKEKLLCNKKWMKNIWGCACVMMFVPILYLGKNVGAYLSYHLQVLMPQVLVMGACGIHKRIDLYVTEWKKKGVQIICIVWCFISILMLGFPTGDSKSEQVEWEIANNYIEKYSENGQVLLLSPMMGYSALDNENITLYANGHNYISGIKEKEIPDTIINTLLMKFHFLESYSQLQQIDEQQEQILNAMIEGKEYNMIAVSSVDRMERFIPTMENAGYKCIDSLDLKTDYRTWNVEFWVKEI